MASGCKKPTFPPPICHWNGASPSSQHTELLQGRDLEPGSAGGLRLDSSPRTDAARLGKPFKLPDSSFLVPKVGTVIRSLPISQSCKSE